MSLFNNFTFIIVFLLIVGRFVLDLAADLLNLRHFAQELPRELRDEILPEKYAQSVRYQKDSIRFDLLRRVVAFAAFVLFWIGGGFQWADQIARSLGLGSIGTGLVFFAILSVLRGALQLAFTVFDTFVIEQRHGFNRTTPAVFVADLIKGTLLGGIIGGLVLGGILWFFEATGPLAWLYAWAAFTLFQLGLLFIAPVVIMPLFNRFTPLAEGPLKETIDAYARSQKFALQGIFTMDGSKRSTKSNAFFTGFGRFRRLVLFDTLITNQTPEELTAVVAHEVGHFRCGHIPRSIALSIGVTAALFLALSQFLSRTSVFAAFRIEDASLYGGLTLFSIVLGPLMRLFGIFTQALSRRHEFEADAFSARTYGRPAELASALRKLSRDNLSHLTPHPLKVLLDASHPPVLERLKRLALGEKTF